MASRRLFRARDWRRDRRSWRARCGYAVPLATPHGACVSTGDTANAATDDLVTHTLPLETLDDGVDPMKKGESIRPIVVY